MNIQIFACDHRKNVDWQLPYIRLGSNNSDACINIKDDQEIAPFATLLSEGSQIWYTYKHIKEFGNPKYIGFCHYRRFFTNTTNKQLIDITANEFKIYYALTADIQYAILKQQNVDGLLPFPFLVSTATPIWNQLYALTKDDMCPKEKQKQLFDNLLTVTPDYLKQAMLQAFNIQQTYLCNIFTVKQEILAEYINIIIPASKLAYDLLKDDFSQLHPRCLGYVLERFTSCYFYAKQISGTGKFLHLPLMTIDGNFHEKWSKQ